MECISACQIFHLLVDSQEEVASCSGDSLLTTFLKSQTNGIATLLKAEREAHEIVSQARKYRQDKLKQAKTDAAGEIDAYKKQKDQELQEFENKNAGGVGALEKDAESQVQGTLTEIKKLGAKKQNEVAKLLVDAVIKPSGEKHINAA